MKGRSILIEDLLRFTVGLPPVAGVALAIGSYLVWHLLAGWTSPLPRDTHGLTLYAGQHFLSTIAAVLQYVLPLLFLLGALGSYISRRKDRRRRSPVGR